ncbi:MAG: GntR family transcriptional regulator [Lachnospiraceae bacterium]|nr:GntR family transcriptional regulator [Lachnospiraceae bacterium]
MMIQIDFHSDEAIYVQLCNQIILGIATSQFREGEQLPSVRALAEAIGVNMHTVNKAYAILQREGFLKIDRRRGAVIALDIDKLRALSEAREELSIVLARAICRNINRNEMHALVDDIYDAWGG